MTFMFQSFNIIFRIIIIILLFWEFLAPVLADGFQGIFNDSKYSFFLSIDTKNRSH